VAVAAAQAGPDSQVQFGGATYRLLCVGCHGADGRGSPAVSRALKFRDVDLTTIALRNGGVFPAGDVAIAMTGLGDTGHARVKMAPVVAMFAEEFKSFASKIVVDELVARRIDHVVAYIESLQAE
jgi:hypothetical protein